MSVVHLIPDDEAKQHKLALDCPCNPTMTTRAGSAMVEHHRADQHLSMALRLVDPNAPTTT